MVKQMQSTITTFLSNLNSFTCKVGIGGESGTRKSVVPISWETDPFCYFYAHCS